MAQIKITNVTNSSFDVQVIELDGTYNNKKAREVAWEYAEVNTLSGQTVGSATLLEPMTIQNGATQTIAYTISPAGATSGSAFQVRCTLTWYGDMAGNGRQRRSLGPTVVVLGDNASYTTFMYSQVWFDDGAVHYMPQEYGVDEVQLFIGHTYDPLTFEPTLFWSDAHTRTLSYMLIYDLYQEDNTGFYMDQGDTFVCPPGEFLLQYHYTKKAIYPFAWTYPKIQYGQYNLTADEWNELACLVYECVRTIDPNTSLQFDEVEPGDQFTADIFNHVLHQIDSYSSYQTDVSAGDQVTAACLNNIVAALNAWIEDRFS